MISILFIILILSVISCVSNYEPAILEIIANTNTVKKGGMISLQCIAIDEDESSIRYLDSLKYNWSASGGLFLSLIILIHFTKYKISLLLIPLIKSHSVVKYIGWLPIL